MIARAFDFLLKTLILLALLNGMVDGALFAQRWIRNSIVELQLNQEGLVRPNLKMAFEPGMGKTPIATTLPNFTIAQDGRRAPRQATNPPANRRILLLGASQTFGMGVTDDQILSTLIEHDHPEWEVMNYAVPGETLFNNRIRLSFLTARGLAPDQVLIMASILEIADRCMTPPPAPKPRATTALERLFEAIGRRVTTSETADLEGIAACTEPERANALVHAIYDEMLAALATADRLNLPARVVLSPTLFSRQLTAEQSAIDQFSDSHYLAFRPIYDALRRLIAEGGENRIIDLTNALDAVDKPFIDELSHFSPAAHRAIADQLGPLIMSYGVPGAGKTEMLKENKE
ncbi:SGNH/GDSL hydrolase family protein [Niveispirillum irakense]|uniref:SGNH/GDSL hydrolase family protein n=1 Tax=Niveispirillum irakense TaxID=34011 RepID=UPI00048ECAFD|nr:SGNH/GDSL hydrolase family protein [Niveispirillum irakense]